MHDQHGERRPRPGPFATGRWPHRRTGHVAAALAVLMSLASCSSQPSGETETTSPGSTEPTTSASSAAPSASSPPAPGQSESPSAAPTEPITSPETIATDLQAPWSITFYRDTPLVSERDTARIVELDDQGQARVVAEIEEAAPAGEGGLLGIAVHEEYLYAYLTTESGNRIDRFELTGQPGSLALGTRESVLTGIPSGTIHNGGRLAFGPDGMLYATTGDGGSSQHAQDVGSLAGKILRMTPTGEVPPDNPFDGSLVYSYGHRNVQGIAWAPDGTMYASEFGQDTWDELNVIEAGGNYGWPVVEGEADEEGFVDPVQQWRPGEASPSGIEVTAGSIYIANLRGERLRVVPLTDLSSSTTRYAGKFGRLRAVTETPQGELWILTNNTDGRGDPGPHDDRIIRVPKQPQ